MSEQIPSRKLTFIGHLDELRVRLMVSFGAIIGCAVVAWMFRRILFNFMTQPFYNAVAREALENVNLNAQGLVIPFVTDIKLCLFLSLIPSSAIILHQAWLFLRPGLHVGERKVVAPLVPIIYLLFLSGVTLGYFVFLPAAVGFLINYGDPQIARFLSIDDYMNVSIILTAGCGLVFQMPIVTYFLSLIGLLTPEIMLRHWRFAVVIIFVVAAVITPTPDPFNMSLMASPMLVLYFLSIGVSRAVSNRRKKEKAEE